MIRSCYSGGKVTGSILSLPITFYCASKTQPRPETSQHLTTRSITTCPRTAEAPPAMPAAPRPWTAEAAWRLPPESPAASRAGWRPATAPPAPYTALPFTYGRLTCCPTGAEARGSPLLPHTTRRGDPHPSNWQRPRVTR